jgi:hypothetical protein
MGHLFKSILERVQRPYRAKAQLLVVQDNTQEGIVDVKVATVLDETQFSAIIAARALARAW